MGFSFENFLFTPTALFDDDSPERPAFPQFDPNQNLQPLIDEFLGLTRQGIGQQVGVPEELGVSSQFLQNLLQQTPEQFTLPVDQIQQALQAQQAIQKQDFLNQIRPTLAQQGQLESSAFTNLLSDFTQQQQADELTNLANLLTTQAQGDIANRQAFLGQQLGATGQLSGLGSQLANIDLQNIQLPFQTVIPSLAQGFGLQQGLEQDLFRQALGAQQQEMDVFNQAEQSRQQTMQLLGSLALGAATGGLGGAFGLTGLTAGQGALLGGLGQLGGTGGFTGSQFPTFGSFPQVGAGGTVRNLRGGGFGQGFTPFTGNQSFLIAR